MKNPYFKIDNFGSLYLEKTYIESDVPIFFTCRDDDGRSYFVSASIQTDEFVSWVATEVSEERIIDVLNDRITLKNIYNKSEKCNVYYIKRIFHTGKTTYELFKRDEINEDLIPVDEPLELSEEEKLAYLPSGQLNSQEFASKMYSSLSKIHLDNESIFFEHAVPAGIFGGFLSDLQDLKAALLLKTSEFAGRVSDRLKKSTQEYVVAINPGSFEVTLQSEQSVLLDDTLERIYLSLNKLMSFDQDNDEFRAFISDFNITAIKKYKKVLDDLISLDQLLAIDTTFPEIGGKKRTYTTKLSRADIAIRKQLVDSVILKSENTIQIKGELDGIDAIKRTFSFTRFDTSEHVSGKIIPELAEAVMNHYDLYHIPSSGTFYLTEIITTDVNETFSTKKYALTQFVRDQ